MYWSRASWTCAAETTDGLSCPSRANVTQKSLTPKTIQLSGLPGGHYYDVQVIARVEGCKDDVTCENESESQVAFVTCDYRCRDRTCLQNPKAK